MQKSPYHNSLTIMAIKAKKLEIQQKRIEFNELIKPLLKDIATLERKRKQELIDYDKKQYAN